MSLRRSAVGRGRAWGSARRGGQGIVWVWRDDLGSGGEHGGSGGWRLDAYGTWVWDEVSPLERPGAGTGALRGRGLSAGASGRTRDERLTGDRALAALEHADPTP